MTKFHINKHGMPAPCRAKEGNCPYGGESGKENHFDSYEEAEIHANKVNREKYGIIPQVEMSELHESQSEEADIVTEEDEETKIITKEEYDAIRNKLVISDSYTVETDLGWGPNFDKYYILRDLDGKRKGTFHELSSTNWRRNLASDEEIELATVYKENVELQLQTEELKQEVKEEREKDDEDAKNYMKRKREVEEVERSSKDDETEIRRHNHKRPSFMDRVRGLFR